MFLFMFGSFLSYPALQQLIHCTICEQTHNCSCTNNKPEEHGKNASESCGLQPVVEQWIEQDTSYWVLYLNLAASLPAIVVALLYGGVSDYYGRRKPFILLPALGAAVNAVLVLILLYTGTTLLPLYLIGSLAAGLLGSSAVFNFAVYSYIADTSSPSKRTIKVGILESMTYFGATLSSLVGGLWVQNQGFIPPFWAILVCNVAVVVYVLLALPSSRPKTTYRRGEGYVSLSADRSISASCTSLLSAVLENFMSFMRLTFSSFDVVIMIITFFIVEINFMAISDTVVVYALGRPLCWPPRLIGYFLAGKILMNGIASLVVLPLFSWCGLPDTVIIIFGLISGIVSLVAIGSAHVAWVMMMGEWSLFCIVYSIYTTTQLLLLVLSEDVWFRASDQHYPKQHLLTSKVTSSLSLYFIVALF